MPRVCRARRMELKVITNPIDQAGPARRLLSNLFYGWGYNFYRREDDLQADDLLIRAKLGQLLCDSRTRLLSVHAAFVRKLLPRDRGGARANPAIVEMERALESAERELQGLETAVLSAAAPEPGRIRRRDRERLATLARLVALDGEALLALVTLRDAIARFEDGAAAALGIDGLLKASGFAALWSRRQAALASAVQ